jgi:hypothetical protein
MALNLQPLCPTCSQKMHKLKQVAPEAGCLVNLSKGYCETCHAWKTLNPEQKVKGSSR